MTRPFKIWYLVQDYYSWQVYATYSTEAAALRAIDRVILKFQSWSVPVVKLEITGSGRGHEQYHTTRKTAERVRVLHRWRKDGSGTFVKATV